MTYDSYFRLGKYDLWLKATGNYRVEIFQGGENGHSVWAGRFLEALVENGVENHLNLKHRRGSFHFRYHTKSAHDCCCELSIPRRLIGRKIIRGELSLAQAKQLFDQLKNI